MFGVIERVPAPGAGVAAEDLDTCACAVSDDLDERKPDANCDAGGEGPEEGCDEDKGEGGQIGPCADADEEDDVCGGFFEEGSADNRDHGTEHGAREVVEVREHEQHAEDCADGQDDGGDGSAAAGGLVDLAATVASEGGERLEAPA